MSALPPPASLSGSPTWLDWLDLALGVSVLAAVSHWLSRQPGSLAVLSYQHAWVVAWLIYRQPGRMQWLVGMFTAGLGDVLSRPLACFAFAGSDCGLNGGVADWMSVAVNLVEVAVAYRLLRGHPAQAWLSGGQLGWLGLQMRGALIPALVGATLMEALAPQATFRGTLAVWVSWVEGGMLSGLVMLPVALQLRLQPWGHSARRLADLDHLALQGLTVGTTWLAVSFLPMPFAYLAVPLLLTAALVDGLVLSVVILSATLTVQAALGVGVFVPPPISRRWEEIFVYLPLMMTLLPVQMLGAAFASLRQGQAELRAVVDRLATANEGLEEFVHVASHDLREPLNSISGLISVIEVDHGSTLPEPALRYLSLAQRAAGQLRALVDDMLAYVRLGRDVASAREPVVLQQLFDQTLLLLRDSVHLSGAQVRQQGLSETVSGHPMLLALLLQNLLSNALKFVPKGCAPRVDVQAQREGDRVHLIVRDQGIGIAAPDQARLFVAFTRLHLRKQYDGTGLGLALCRRIVDLHGGAIWIDSVLGRGTTVHVLLPLESSVGQQR